MATRRDYELVAESIRLCRESMPALLRKSKPEDATASFDIDIWATGLSLAVVEYISRTIAEGFAEQNKAFDVARFMRDCGVAGEE